MSEHARQKQAIAGCAAAGEWAALVPRLRALRESLTSHRAAASFVRAFELSADAALRAGDHAEWLKAASALLSIYPGLAPAAEARGARAARAPPGEPASRRRCPGPAAAQRPSAAGPGRRRWCFPAPQRLTGPLLARSGLATSPHALRASPPGALWLTQ